MILAPRERSRNDRALIVPAVKEAASRLVGLREALDPDTGRVLNNEGPDIDRLRRIAGVGRIGGAGAHCAVDASAAIRLGCDAVHRRLPFSLSAGAKRLTYSCAAAGGWIVRPTQWTRLGRWRGELDERDLAWALLVLWHRGREQSWRRHVEVFEAYDRDSDTMWTWAGNVAPHPRDLGPLLELGVTPVRGRAIYHRRTHPAGSWRRRFAALAEL